MTTPYKRALVSLAAALMVGLGACARVSAGAEPAGMSLMGTSPLTIRFDNDALERVQVYMVGENRQWLLGRVEPGAIAILRIPEEALAADAMFVRLAVLTGDRLSQQVAREPRATLTILQPAVDLLSQRWTFSQGALTSVRRQAPRGVLPRSA